MINHVLHKNLCNSIKKYQKKKKIQKSLYLSSIHYYEIASNINNIKNDYLFSIQQNASPDVVKVLAGNKCECTQAQRMVDKDRGVKASLKKNR